MIYQKYCFLNLEELPFINIPVVSYINESIFKNINLNWINFLENLWPIYSSFINSEEESFINVPIIPRINIDEALKNEDLDWLVEFIKSTIPKKKKKKSRWKYFLIFPAIPLLKILFPSLTISFLTSWFNYEWLIKFLVELLKLRNLHKLIDTLSSWLSTFYPQPLLIPKVRFRHFPLLPAPKILKPGIILRTLPAISAGTQVTMPLVYEHVKEVQKQKAVELEYLKSEVKTELKKLNIELDEKKLEKAYEEDKLSEIFILDHARETIANKKKFEIKIHSSQALETIKQEHPIFIEPALQLKKFIEQKVKELDTIDTSFRSVEPEYKYSEERTKQELYAEAQPFVEQLITYTQENLKAKVQTKKNELLKSSEGNTFSSIATEMKTFLEEKTQELKKLETFKDLDSSLKIETQSLFIPTETLVQELTQKIPEKLQTQTEAYIKELEQDLNEDVKSLKQMLDNSLENIQENTKNFNVNKDKIKQEFQSFTDSIKTFTKEQVDTLKKELTEEIEDTKESFSKVKDLDSFVVVLGETNKRLNEMAHYAEKGTLLSIEESIEEAFEKKQEILKKIIVDEVLGDKKQHYISSIENNNFLKEKHKSILKRALEGNIKTEDVEEIQKSAESLKKEAQYRMRNISRIYEKDEYKWCNDSRWWMATIKYVGTWGGCIGISTAAHSIALYEGSQINWSDLLFLADMILLMGGILSLGATFPAFVGKLTAKQTVKLGLKKLLQTGTQKILTKGTLINVGKESLKKVGTLANKGFQTALARGNVLIGTESTKVIALLGGVGLLSMGAQQSTSIKTLNSQEQKIKSIYSI